MDEAMRQALVPVLHDLDSAAVTAPLIELFDRTGHPDWPDPDRPLVMLRSPTGTQMNVQVSRLAPASAQIVSVADQVQIFVFEELWGERRRIGRRVLGTPLRTL